MTKYAPNAVLAKAVAGAAAAGLTRQILSRTSDLPAEAIVQAAKDRHCVLLVMASRDRHAVWPVGCTPCRLSGCCAIHWWRCWSPG